MQWLCPLMLMRKTRIVLLWMRLYALCVSAYTTKNKPLHCTTPYTVYFPACITLTRDSQLAASVQWLKITANMLLIIAQSTAKYSDWWLRFLWIYKIIIPLIAGLIEPIVQMQNLCVINKHVALLRKTRQWNLTSIDLRCCISFDTN